MKATQYRANIVVIALVLGIQPGAKAGETLEQVTVYSDVAGAQELLTGDYAQALTLMADKKQENSIFLENNLCVAHILSNNFEQARQRCMAALEETKRSANYGEWLERTKSTRVRRLYRERALKHLHLLDALDPERLVKVRP